MKVAVWYSRQYGPAVLAVLPKKKDQKPETARIPYKIPPGPLTQLAAKGEQPTWQEWADHLCEALPYDGQWAVLDVPDGMLAQEALSWTREKFLSKQLDSGQA